MNTRQLLSVGIDIGTTTTQVIFSHLWSWLTVRRCRRCRATNSSNAKLAGKARCSLPLSINRVV
ncbi:ethanolamine ammonia-lyase reactivating factor EutA [Escherichia coli]|nr:ethanolamine ammonia-lyase reactivating factor EutA [Escherichia coli]